MSHCVPHAPLAQTWPLPQLVPSDSVPHPEVLTSDSHVWHALFGFALPFG